MERTLSIIKPDGVDRNLIGKILSQFETHGLRIIALQMRCLSKSEAEGFYAVHRQRPFFTELVEYMCSGAVVVSVLEGEQAISRHREIMGATDPAKATSGTIRALYGKSIGENTVHGSDARETAQFEVDYFFPHLGDG